MELSYHFLAIAHAPQEIVSSKMLPAVEELLVKLEEYNSRPSEYEGGHGYWDDYCLAKFLEGVCLRYIAHAARNPPILCLHVKT